MEQTTEFVGTVKSRRSTTVQPQVEGFVTRILVRSGDRVQPGTALMQIDPSMQQAAVSNLESLRAAREADLRLRAAGGRRGSRRCSRRARRASRSWSRRRRRSPTPRPSSKAIEAQIRQQKVALGYHRVTAPTAGVVGDIPVRVGDSVTRSTVLTTIDQNAGLEVYINVPVQEAAALRVGLPVHLVDDRGPVASTAKISFVSPSVDAETQSVLAKASLDEAGQPAAPSSSSAPDRLDGGAGAHRPLRGRQPRQRPVLRLRGRERRRRKRPWPASARSSSEPWSATTTS